MSRVFLSRQIGEESSLEVLDNPVKLTTVEDGNVWKALYPIDVPMSGEKQEQCHGTIYVYLGDVTDGKIRGTPHYAIHYDLIFQHGKLSVDSEMWMASTYNTSTIVFTPDDRIGSDEWFDFRPIPEIEGENTDDPKLLGVTEGEVKKRAFRDTNTR